MDAARELPQLGQRDRQLLADVVDRRGQPAVAEPRLEHPQVQGQRHQVLLRVVVQVALDLAARVVGRLDDPQPRHPQLLHPRAQLGLQSLVVDRQRGGLRGGGDELGRGVELGVVHDRRHPLALVVDRRPGAAGARGGQLDLAAGVVDEDPALRQPVGDVQRPVAEPLGEHLAHRALLGRARAQHPAGELAQRGPGRPPGAAIETIVAGRASAHSARPERRAELPRADEPPVVARQPAHARARRARPRATPAQREHEADEHRRQLQDQQREDAPERPVAEQLPDAAGRSAGRSAAGAPPAAGSPGAARPPRAATSAARCRSAAAGRPTAAREPCRGPGRRPVRAGRSGPGRARRSGRAARAARRAGAARGRARAVIAAASTVTSPLVLSAWITKPASSTATSPPMCVVPVSDCASIE